MTASASDEFTATSDNLSPTGLASDNTPVDETKCLFVNTTTWTRDSHDLFDYEARHVHKKSYFLQRSARIFRTVLDIQVVPEGAPFPTQTCDYLLAIHQMAGRYIVAPVDRGYQLPSGIAFFPKKVWLVVKDLPDHSHWLKEGDVLKLGRFKLRVKQIAKDNESCQELKLDDTDIPDVNVDQKDATLMQCRICLLDGGDDNDPLVSPCHCKGSIKFVHLECLRYWINGRLSLLDDQQHRDSFFFRQLHCELCKATFPSAINYNSERVQIVKIPKIESPFIILENIVGNNSRGLHVLSMGLKKELKLGRGHESDVRIADVSISRHHATIKWINGEFVLEDHNSKFGTLVSLRKVLTVPLTRTIAIQAGRTIFNFSLRQPPCLFEDVLTVNEDGVLDPADQEELQRKSEILPPESEQSWGNSNNLDITGSRNEGSLSDQHTTQMRRESIPEICSQIVNCSKFRNTNKNRACFYKKSLTSRKNFARAICDIALSKPICSFIKKRNSRHRKLSMNSSLCKKAEFLSAEKNTRLSLCQTEESHGFNTNFPEKRLRIPNSGLFSKAQSKHPKSPKRICSVNYTMSLSSASSGLSSFSPLIMSLPPSSKSSFDFLSNFRSSSDVSTKSSPVHHIPASLSNISNAAFSVSDLVEIS